MERNLGMVLAAKSCCRACHWCLVKEPCCIAAFQSFAWNCDPPPSSFKETASLVLLLHNEGMNFQSGSQTTVSCNRWQRHLGKNHLKDVMTPCWLQVGVKLHGLEDRTDPAPEGGLALGNGSEQTPGMESSELGLTETLALKARRLPFELAVGRDMSLLACSGRRSTMAGLLALVMITRGSNTAISASAVQVDEHRSSKAHGCRAEAVHVGSTEIH